MLEHTKLIIFGIQLKQMQVNILFFQCSHASKSSLITLLNSHFSAENESILELR